MPLQLAPDDRPGLHRRLRVAWNWATEGAGRAACRGPRSRKRECQRTTTAAAFVCHLSCVTVVQSEFSHRVDPILD